MRHIIKSFLLSLAMLMVATGAFAQDTVDAVYLKNGSVIRGILLELKPSESLKIRTSDGKTLTYPLNEVDRVTKEEHVYTINGKRVKRDGRALDSNGNYVFDGKGRKTGYRGFAEIGYTFGMGSNGSDRIQVMTSHGYQFCPYFFAGLGVGYHYFREGPAEGMNGIPVYAHLRSEVMNNTISPFIDVKFGYAFGDPRGIFFEPTLGCRFGLGKQFGISVGVGYTVQDIDTDANGLGWRSGKHENYGGMCAKIALDF